MPPLGVAGRTVTSVLWGTYPSVPLDSSVMPRWASGMSVLSMGGRTLLDAVLCCSPQLELEPSCLGEGASPSTWQKEVCLPRESLMCLCPIWGFQEGKARPREGSSSSEASYHPWVKAVPLQRPCKQRSGIQVKHSSHLGWVRACSPALARVLPLGALSHAYSPVPQPPPPGGGRSWQDSPVLLACAGYQDAGPCCVSTIVMIQN